MCHYKTIHQNLHAAALGPIKGELSVICFLFPIEIFYSGYVFVRGHFIHFRAPARAREREKKREKEKRGLERNFKHHAIRDLRLSTFSSFLLSLPPFLFSTISLGFAECYYYHSWLICFFRFFMSFSLSFFLVIALRNCF